ncbi:MAG: hypothetical protein HRU51_04825 [Xanthomonadales bacterium]|nr:hypothetical protein [Xanthomonadales bacterium]
MKSDSTLRLALAVLLLSLQTACKDAADSAADLTEPKRYVHSLDGAPASLDPAQAGTRYAKFLVLNLYDTLYRYRYLARPYELAPNLAAAMPELSKDGLTLTIRLKRGVHFIDDPAFADGKGREVTAQDVIYSLQRHFDPATRSQGAWLWQGRIEGLDEWKAQGSNYEQPVSGLRALDRYTLEIRLTQPFPQFVHTLAQGFAGVVPREAVTAYGLELGRRAVGSGPFRLQSIDSARARLVRNEHFRQETFDLALEGFDPERDQGLGLTALEGRSSPFIDELEIEFIAEDAARWSSFYSGLTQFTKVPVAQFGQVLESTAPPTLKPELQERFQLQAAPELGFVYTVFNMADPEIGYSEDPQRNERNRALRCAIVKGFDWTQRNQRFFGGIGELFPGIIPPRLPEFDPDQDRGSTQADPAAARALLAAADWHADNLPVLEYGFPTSVTERQLFEQFRGFMEAIGYPREKIQPLSYASFGDYYRAYSQGQVMLITSAWTMDYPDAENTVQLFYGPHRAPGANAASFDDPQFNAAFSAAATLPPSPQRTELYRAANQRVMDECAAITGLVRRLVLLWDRQVILQPDWAFVGGSAMRFVDLRDPDGQR